MAHCLGLDTLLPDVWSIVRASGLDPIDRCQLSRCASWLHALDPGPYLGGWWNMTDVKGKEATAILREWFRCRLPEPMRFQRVDDGAPGDFFCFDIAWMHNTPTKWQGNVYFTWRRQCLLCDGKVAGGDQHFCRAHYLRLYHMTGDPRWFLQRYTCPRCGLDADRFFSGWAAIEATSLSELIPCLYRIRYLVPPDVHFTTSDGCPCIRHPNGTVCCRDKDCGDCPSCLSHCEQGC
jgi:hypothetical protein